MAMIVMSAWNDSDSLANALRNSPAFSAEILENSGYFVDNKVDYKALANNLQRFAQNYTTLGVDIKENLWAIIHEFAEVVSAYAREERTFHDDAHRQNISNGLTDTLREYLEQNNLRTEIDRADSISRHAGQYHDTVYLYAGGDLPTAAKRKFTKSFASVFQKEDGTIELGEPISLSAQIATQVFGEEFCKKQNEYLSAILAAENYVEKLPSQTNLTQDQILDIIAIAEAIAITIFPVLPKDGQTFPDRIHEQATRTYRHFAAKEEGHPLSEHETTRLNIGILTGIDLSNKDLAAFYTLDPTSFNALATLRDTLPEGELTAARSGVIAAKEAMAFKNFIAGTRNLIAEGAEKLQQGTHTTADFTKKHVGSHDFLTEKKDGRYVNGDAIVHQFTPKNMPPYPSEKEFGLAVMEVNRRLHETDMFLATKSVSLSVIDAITTLADAPPETPLNVLVKDVEYPDKKGNMSFTGIHGVVYAALVDTEVRKPVHGVTQSPTSALLFEMVQGREDVIQQLYDEIRTGPYALKDFNAKENAITLMQALEAQGILEFASIVAKGLEQVATKAENIELAEKLSKIANSQTVSAMTTGKEKKSWVDAVSQHSPKTEAHER